MRTLKKSDCAVCWLILKSKWYNKILNEGKREEYREYKPHWNTRFTNWKRKVDKSSLFREKLIPIVSFSLGYKKPDMHFICEEVFLREWGKHPDWGEPEEKHFVLRLGERVDVVEDFNPLD